MDYIQTRELYHHGIKGQKWGVRRFQDESGELTAEGKARYGYDENTGKLSREGNRQYKQDLKQQRKDITKEFNENFKKNTEKYGGKFWISDVDYLNARRDTLKQLEGKWGETAMADVNKYAAKKQLAVGLSIVAALNAVSLGAMIALNR